MTQLHLDDTRMAHEYSFCHCLSTVMLRVKFEEAGIDGITRLVDRILTHVTTTRIIFVIVEEANHMSDTIKVMLWPFHL